MNIEVKETPKVGEKRTHKNKENKKKEGSGDKGKQPVLNRRQKQKVSDLIKKLRVSKEFEVRL